ncbi:MAG: 30S ribosome-binding factor RbfA [Candidatus Omnitrophota bacterium]
MGLRHDKVVSALKREISSIIHDELKDSRLGFATIVRVELTDDLRFARIYFSVLGGEKEQKATQEALEGATPFIRCLAGQRLSLRFVPEISFRIDRSIEYSIRIQKELDSIKEQNGDKESN